MNSVALALLGTAVQAPIVVPFRIAEDAMIVDATVNGKKASFMFDTGYSGALVMDDSIQIGPASGTQTLRDFVGEFSAKTVKLRTLSVGAANIPISDDTTVVQQPLRSISQAYNTHVDGIMGYQVIRNFVTEFNFEKKQMILHPKSYNVTTRTPDNQKTFLVRMLPTGNNSIELTADAPSGKRMVLALDTGNAFYATTHKDVLERVGLWKEGQKPKFMKLAGVASGTVETFHMRMPAMKIFGVPVKSSVWSIIDLPASSADGDGTVGFGFLKHFNFTIDYDRRRVWMDNYAGKVADDELGEVGISAMTTARTGRVEVLLVSNESPAAKAGIKTGDHILSIDGKDLHRASFHDVDALLSGPVGSKVALALSRGGSLIRVELERAALVNTPE